MLYKSTTKDAIFLSRSHGGIDVKLFSSVYYCIRVSFIVKMLNHHVENFRNITQSSLDLDVRKWGISESSKNNNFFGYEVNYGFLISRTKFWCKTEWIELNRYCWKLNIKLQWKDKKAAVIFDSNSPCHAKNLNKAFFEYTQLELKAHSQTLRLQGEFLQIRNRDKKISQTIHYNWKLNDQLLIFCAKARLNILPTNFPLVIWNGENNPICPFWNYATENMAHLLNRCQKEFGNFYSKRLNRIADYLQKQFKTIDCKYKTDNNKHNNTIIAQHRQRLVVMMKNCFCGMVGQWKVFSLSSSQDHCQRSLQSWISDMPKAGFEPKQNLRSDLVKWSCAVVITTTPQHHNRKPDILLTDLVWRNIEVIEVTVCHDLYFKLARNGKFENYTLLIYVLAQLGYKVKLHVLCFGSLGNISKDCGSIIRVFHI